MLSNQSDDSYTISFFFYNPVVSTGRLHVLLQDENGVYPIIAIDASGTRIGCFDISGHFVDSGIHLEEQKYRDKWLHFTMIYDSYTIEDKVKLHGVVTFYLDGINTEQIESDGVLNQKKVYSWNGKEAKEEKPAYIDLPKTIKYIGNSKDYKHPFGPFCDLRIFRGVKNSIFIQKLLKFYVPKFQGEIDINDFHKLILDKLSNSLNNYIKETDYLSEEVIYPLVVFINILLAKTDVRNKFLDFELVVKIAKEGLSYESLKNRKEITNFLRSIS